MKTAHDAHGLPTVANPPPSKKERATEKAQLRSRASKKNQQVQKEVGKDLILFLANGGTTPHDSALHSVSRGFDSRGSSMMRPTFNAQARPDKRTFRRVCRRFVMVHLTT